MLPQQAPHFGAGVPGEFGREAVKVMAARVRLPDLRFKPHFEEVDLLVAGIAVEPERRGEFGEVGEGAVLQPGRDILLNGLADVAFRAENFAIGLGFAPEAGHQVADGHTGAGGGVTL